MNESELTDRIARLEEKYDKLTDRIGESNAVLVGINTKLDCMNTNFSDLKADIKALTSEPKKRWNSVIYSIIQTVITVVLSVAVTGALYIGTHIKG
jgi:hypothetical protein